MRFWVTPLMLMLLTLWDMGMPTCAHVHRAWCRCLSARVARTFAMAITAYQVVV